MQLKSTNTKRRTPMDPPSTSWTTNKENQQHGQQPPYSKVIIVVLLFVVVFQGLRNNSALIASTTPIIASSTTIKPTTHIRHHIGVIMDNNNNNKPVTTKAATTTNQQQQQQQQHATTSSSSTSKAMLIDSKFNVPQFHANLGIVSTLQQGQQRMHPHPTDDKTFVRPSITTNSQLAPTGWAPTAAITTTTSSNEETKSIDIDNEYVQLGIATALKIAKNELPQETIAASDHNRYEQVGEWKINTHLLRQQSNEEGGCIVYSFGVGQEDYYTNFMANHSGCEVFAFDPSVTHYDSHPNVTFFPYGLMASSTTRATTWSHPVYGKVNPAQLRTLPDIITELHHHNRTIAAVKFDCEGCEFGAFADMRRLPDTRVLSYQTEFHLTTTLGMNSTADVGRVGEFGAFFHERSCRVVSYKPNKGYTWDRTVFPLLVAGSVPDGTCCYEYTFVCDR